MCSSDIFRYETAQPQLKARVTNPKHQCPGYFALLSGPMLLRALSRQQSCPSLPVPLPVFSF